MTKAQTLITCNSCGATVYIFSTHTPVKDITEYPRSTILYAKKEFAKRGWKTARGHELCPECVKDEAAK